MFMADGQAGWPGSRIREAHSQRLNRLDLPEDFIQPVILSALLLK